MRTTLDRCGNPHKQKCYPNNENVHIFLHLNDKSCFLKPFYLFPLLFLNRKKFSTVFSNVFFVKGFFGPCTATNPERIFWKTNSKMPYKSKANFHIAMATKELVHLLITLYCHFLARDKTRLPSKNSGHGLYITKKQLFYLDGK